MKRVLILTSIDGDWEGIYIDGKLMAQAHTLGEGSNRLFLLRMSETHNFTSEDVVEKECNHVDDAKFLNLEGRFPDNVADLKGQYNE